MDMHCYQNKTQLNMYILPPMFAPSIVCYQQHRGPLLFVRMQVSGQLLAAVNSYGRGSRLPLFVVQNLTQH